MLAIIVPYRNRPEHLAQFIPHMNNYLPDAKIVIVEQVDDKPFNRGKLINCAFIETTPSFFVAHDVDMLPISVDYYSASNPMPSVVQLAKSYIQLKYYLGGVTYFSSACFTRVGGYHNDYFSRAEDNELAFHLQRLKITVLNRFGTFHQLPHPRTGPEFIPELWAKAQLPRNINMLENCHYELISKEVLETHTHLKVLL